MNESDRHQLEIEELKYQLAYAENLTDEERLEIRRKLVELLNDGGSNKDG